LWRGIYSERNCEMWGSSVGGRVYARTPRPRGKRMPEQLVIENLTVRYGDTAVVKNLDLRINAGEWVTLLGPSGCGKTTILRCIAGLERCSGGSIRIGNRLVASPSGETPPELRNVNMVFQNYAVWPHMTVRQNVSFGLKLMKLSPAEVRRRTEQALDLVGLGAYGERYGTELSGGQQQRVALARAIVTEPDLLLFDEPLSNLDAALREQMRVELRELHDRLGKTAIYVTHDQSEAMAMSDRVVLINEGRIAQDGTPRELFERPSTRFAAQFLGFANMWDGVLSDIGPSGELSVTIDPSGSRLHVLDPNARRHIGARGSVCARAERVEIAARPTADAHLNMWAGRIKRVSYQGSTIRYEVKIGETGELIVRAETHPRLSLAPGDEVCVRIPPGDLVWLPGDGESPGGIELEETLEPQEHTRPSQAPHPCP
jgi:iron(III) transport system ATP-binding protein